MHYPAADRNREPILSVLRDWLTEPGLVLEIASGTGQHAAHMARHLPHLVWQPTDISPDALASLDAWTTEAALPNLRPPRSIDTTQLDWGLGQDEQPRAIVCCNMVHIAPWEATLGLLQGAGRSLKEGGILYLYGPYTIDGTFNAPSNVDFDRSLRARDARWGLRDITEVTRLAEAAGLSRQAVIDMPANNYSLIYRKDP